MAVSKDNSCEDKSKSLTINSVDSSAINLSDEFERSDKSQNFLDQEIKSNGIEGVDLIQNESQKCENHEIFGDKINEIHEFHSCKMKVDEFQNSKAEPISDNNHCEVSQESSTEPVVPNGNGEESIGIPLLSKKSISTSDIKSDFDQNFSDSRDKIKDEHHKSISDCRTNQSLSVNVMEEIRNEKNSGVEKKKKKRKKKGKYIFESTPKPSNADAIAGMGKEIIEEISVFENYGRRPCNADIKSYESVPERLDEKSVYESHGINSTKVADFSALKPLKDAQHNILEAIASRPGKGHNYVARLKSVFEGNFFKDNDKNDSPRAINLVNGICSHDMNTNSNIVSNDTKGHDEPSVFESYGSKPHLINRDSLSDFSSESKFLYESQPEFSKAYVKWDSKVDESVGADKCVFENEPAPLEVHTSWRNSKHVLDVDQSRTVFENNPVRSSADVSCGKDVSSSYEEYSDYTSESSEDEVD